MLRRLGAAGWKAASPGTYSYMTQSVPPPDITPNAVGKLKPADYNPNTAGALNDIVSGISNLVDPEAAGALAGGKAIAAGLLPAVARKAAAKEAITDVGKSAAGDIGRTGLEEAQGAAEAAADRAAGNRPTLEGLPTKGITIGGSPYVPGPIGFIHDAAEKYMSDAGLPYNPPTTYAKVDKDRAARIADAYDAMPHDPDNPAVKASYNAMINETLGQYRALKDSGLNFEFIKPGMDDPYKETPRLAAKDVQDNHHLWVFPSSTGFGSDEAAAEALKSNPLLRPVPDTIGGEPATANDIFRAVHDVFGHLKDGVGFRAEGEENAWRSHSGMYSDLARPAMTSETRGQNSWVNYGPHGDANRKASAADTIYADQKTGLLPSWVMEEGRGDTPIQKPQVNENFREPIGSPLLDYIQNSSRPAQSPSDVAAPAIARTRLTTPEGLAIQSPAYTKESQAVLKDIANGPKGAGPLDLTTQAQTPNVPQVPLERYAPPRGTSPRLTDALQNPDVLRGVSDSIAAGKASGADKWYHTEPVRQAFISALGGEQGPQEFARFMNTVAATSPRSDVPTNIRNASYYYGQGAGGGALPDKLSYPYGHVAQNLHRQNFNTISNGGWDIMQNPKPASFSQNLQGNLSPVTVDTHAFRNIGMRTGDPRFLDTQVSAMTKGDTGPNSLVSRFGEINRPGIVTYKPQQLFNEGRLSMDEAKNIPSFWRAAPRANEYGAAEDLYTKLGAEHGLSPADAQAAAWSGGGNMTGLASPPTHTFPELLNERILYTARMRGEDPQDTLRDFITGKKPLLSIAGAAAGGGALAAAQQPRMTRRAAW